MRKKIIFLLSVSMMIRFAAPASADVTMSGIFDAMPSDGNEFFPLDYKAIEFYTDTAISGAEMQQYFLRGEFLQFGVIPMTIDLPFEPTDVEAKHFFYAPAASPGAFFDVYDPDENSDTDGWEPNPRIGSPSPKNVMQAGRGAFHDGFVQYTLMHVTAGGITNAVDRFGSTALNYDNTWAYRKDFTEADDSTFNMNEWNFGTVNDLLGVTVAEVSTIVPFGTFVIPEPETIMLYGFGLVVLARKLRMPVSTGVARRRKRRAGNQSL